MVVPQLAQVVEVLEGLYPARWAQEWDRVGLVCGDPAEPVERVLLAVDPVADVADEAVELGAQLVLAHHPLLLRPVSALPATSAGGRVVHRLLRAGCALYTAHTNADTARPGVSDALARVLGLVDLVPLDPSPAEPVDAVVVHVPEADGPALLEALWAAGAGRVGEYDRVALTAPATATFRPGPRARPAVGVPGTQEVVAEHRVQVVVPRARREAVLAAARAAHPYEEPVIDVLEQAATASERGVGRVGALERPEPLRAFAERVAAALPATAGGVRVAGDPGALVSRVAVCGGSGDSLLGAARAAGVDAYVTADLRHHPASGFLEQCAAAGPGGGPGGPALVDVAHWASEWPWLHGAAERLAAALAARDLQVACTVSERRSDPWDFHVASPAAAAGGVR